MEQLLTRNIPFEQIRSNVEGLLNARTSFPHLEELKNSIQSDGLLTPLIVASATDEWDFEDYVLIAGESRLRAIRMIREEWISEHGDSDEEIPFEEITCAVYEGDLSGAIVLGLIDNLKRENLNPADEAEAIYRLVEKLNNQSEVAQVLGMSQPSVSNKYNLKKNLIPEGFEALRDGRLKLSKAKKIAKILNDDKTPNFQLQAEVLEEILESDADIPEGQTRRRVKTYRSKKEVEELRQNVSTASDVRDEVDEDHRRSLHQFLRWYFCEIDTDDMLFRVDDLNLDDYEFDYEDEEDDVEEEETTTTKRRIRVGS